MLNYGLGCSLMKLWLAYLASWGRGGCWNWRGWERQGHRFSSLDLHFSLFSTLLFFSSSFFCLSVPSPITSLSGVCAASGWHTPAESCSAHWVSHASRRPAGHAVLVLPGCLGPPAGSQGRHPQELLMLAVQPPPVCTGARACLYRMPLSSAVHALRAGLGCVARPLPQPPRSRRSHGAREPLVRPSEGTRTVTANATARAAAGTAVTAL